jgi:hypothetical protein
MPSGGSQYWAAGAGYEWALDQTQDGLDYLFPNGITNEAFEADRDENPELKMWDIPTTLLYPDWNEWLPHHHPMDIFGDRWETQTVGPRDRNVWEIYEDPNYDGGYLDFIDCWDNSGGSAAQCTDEARTFFDRLGRAANRWANSHSGSWAESAARNITQWEEQAARGAQITKWGSVKIWEVMHTYDMADEAYRVTPGATDQLQWPAERNRLPFDIAPHIVGPYTADDPNFGAPWTSYLNTAWYDLNTVINHGKGQAIGINPNDWKYQVQFISSGNVVQYLKTVMKVQEICDSYEGQRNGNTSMVPAMWHQRMSHCDFGTRYVWRLDRWDEIEDAKSGAIGQVLEAAFRSQVETMMFKYSPTSGGEFNFIDVDAEWDRETGTSGWEPETVEPKLSDVWYRDKLTPSRYLKTLDYLNSLNVKPTLLDSAAHWLDNMNPSSQWDVYKCTRNGGTLDCSKPSLLESNRGSADVSVSLRIPTSPSLLQAPASFTIRVDVSDPEEIDQVIFYADDVALGSRSTNYEYVWTHVPAGTHTLHAEAITTGGATATSDPVTVTVDEGTTSTGTIATQSIQLEPGWNIISTRVAPSPSALDLIFEATEGDIELVKDGNGATYAPAENVNRIEHWNPFQAYMVHAKRASSITIDGEPLNPAHTPVRLEQGWNLVTFLPETEMTVEEALASISDALVIAKDEQGNTYIPAYGVNTIGMMTPEKGYKLFLSQDAELIYPTHPETAPTKATLLGR